MSCKRALAPTFVLLLTSSLAVAEVNQASIDKTIPLIVDFSKAQDGAAWIRAHRSQLDTTTAETAEALANDDLAQGRPSRAHASASFAAAAYSALDQPAAGLQSLVTVQQVLFMRAEKPNAYASVAKDCANLAVSADRAHKPELGAKFRILAADSTFFQAQGEQGTTADNTLLTALEQVTAVLPRLPTVKERVWAEQLVSLTGGVVQESTGRIHARQEAYDLALRKLAPIVERTIPADYTFRLRNDPNVKTVNFALAFADLSSRYGNASSAGPRFEFVEREATTSKDLDLLLNAYWAHYRAEKRADPRSARLATLRRRAFDAVSSFRAGFRSRTGRLWAAYRADVLLGEMATDQLENAASTDLAPGFAWVESMKARGLLDALSAPRAREIATPAAKQLEREVLGFGPPKPNDDVVMDEMRLVSQLSGFNVGADMGKRSQSLQVLERSYATEGSGFQQSTSPPSLAAIQRALQPGEVILEYFEAYSELGPRPEIWILQITRQQATATKVQLPRVSFDGRMSVDGAAPVDSGPLQDLVVGTRTAIRTAKDEKANEYLRSLHQLLLKPLLDRGLRLDQVKRLIVVPHGALDYLPFAALLDGAGKYLIESAPIVMVPSAAVWQVLQARTSTRDTWAAFVDPRSNDPQAPPLKFAAQEGTFIARQFAAGKSQVFPQANSTWTNLRRAAPTAGYLHFGTHGAFPEDDAFDMHALMLTPEKGAMGLLHAADVRRLDLRATRLVTLSVCNGGLYRMGPANEPYGLISAFLEAGAGATLAPLWPVDDQFGRDFMVDFYKHLFAEGAAGAYQLSTVHFIKRGERLGRWASFVVQGSGRP